MKTLLTFPFRTEQNRTEQSRVWRITFLFSLLILIAMVFTACHVSKDELPEPVANTQIAAVERCINDCTQCPQQNCCCVIELISGTGIIFDLCGNFIGCGFAPACGPIFAPAPCGTISGVSDVTDPMAPSSLYHFCIAGDEDVYIFNTNQFVTAIINVHCSFPDTLTNHHITTLIIEPQSRAFLQIGGDCLTSECD